MVESLILLFQFAHHKARVARHELLSRAVHDKIQIFENNGADKGGPAFRLDNGREDTVAAEELDENAFDGIAHGSGVVGVADSDFAGWDQTQFVYYPTRQNQTSRPAVDHTPNCHAALFSSPSSWARH
jgi:hypothetical protein